MEMETKLNKDQSKSSSKKTKDKKNENKIKKVNKNDIFYYILVFIGCAAILILSIILYYRLMKPSLSPDNIDKPKIDKQKIDNNIEKNKGVLQLIIEDEKKIKLQLKKNY